MPSEYVGLNVLAEWLGLTQRRVIQLVDEGVVEKKGRGQYHLQTNIARYIDYLRQMAEAGGKKTDLSHEKLLTARIERRRRELEYAQIEGTLITVDSHKAALAKAFDLVRSNVRNLPGALAPRLVGLEDPREVQQILVREIDDALRAIVSKAQRRAEDTEGLPEDLPGRRALVAHGVVSLVDLLDLEELTDVPGVGKATARKIRAWLEERS